MTAWASLVLRMIVGGVLIYSGASKAIGPSAEFAASLAAYHLLPHAALMPIAMVWPWVELLVGTYLFFGFYTRWVALGACGMFAFFLTVLVSSMLRGIDPGSCGCFGIGINLSIRQTAALDTGLLILSLLLTRLTRTSLPYSLDHWIKP